VVSGGARGIDTLGEIWAQSQGIPVTRFPADWARYGGQGQLAIMQWFAIRRPDRRLGRRFSWHT